jgi:dUTP pyrophosphatase
MSRDCGRCYYSTVESYDFPCSNCSEDGEYYKNKETEFYEKTVGEAKQCQDCKFQKTSWGEFPCNICADQDEFQPKEIRGFTPAFDIYGRVGDIITLPLRGTKTSAGYDFYTTTDLTIRPQQIVKFESNVKTYMQDDEVLIIVPRSSTGFTHNLMLLNTVGVIDSDFKGNIGVGLFNYRPAVEYGKEQHFMTVTGDVVSMPTVVDLTEKNTVFLPKGTKIVQGIFMKYLEADNCNSDVERDGGIGSTGF